MEKLEQVGATSEGHKESQSEAKTAKTGKSAKLKKKPAKLEKLSRFYSSNN